MATAADGGATTRTIRYRPGAGLAAAARAIERNTVRLDLPLVGAVTAPSPDRLAFYAGLAVMAAIGVVDWPVAAVLGVGHLLAEDRHHRLLQDFGRALEEA